MKVRWTLHALEQMDALFERVVELRGEAACGEFRDQILERVGSLARLPWSAPRWGTEHDLTFRRLVVRDHVVFYRIAELDDAVYILAVRHGRQRPLEPDEVPEL